MQLSKKHSWLLKGLVSVMLLTVISARVDTAKIASTFAHVGPWHYLIALGLLLIQLYLLAVRYFILLRGSSLHRSVMELLRINFICVFYSVYLPAAIGPAVVRWLKVARSSEDRRSFALITIYERTIFLLGLFITTFVALSLSPGVGEDQLTARLWGTSLLLSLLALGGLQIILSERAARFFMHWSALGFVLKKMGFEEGGTKKILRVKALSSVSLSLLWQIFYAAQFFFLALALDLGMTVTQAVWLSSVSLLLQSLPVSLAGLGVREGVLAFLLLQVGYAPEVGVSLGLLQFSQFLITVVIGGILQIAEKP